MTKWTLGSSYPIALTISLVPALSPLTVQAAPLNAPPATGILNSLCYDYVPKIEKPSADQDANAQPVEVDADRLEAKQGGTAVYEGDVKVRQGVRKFDSDYAQLDQKSRDVIASATSITTMARLLSPATRPSNPTWTPRTPS